jgi:hypothetical protein
MRRRRSILAAVMAVGLAIGVSGVSAADDLPRTFEGCVAKGGDIRRIDGELTCRLIHASDFRVYGTVPDECGEQVDIEIWGEDRTGVVTYFLAPERTIELPEVGMHDAWASVSATAIPCRAD